MSGGGDRGCVLVGILDELHEMKGGIEWEEVAGISAGALVACMIAQTDKENFKRVVNKLKSIFLSGGFHVVDNWVWGGQVINLVDALMFHQSIFQNTPMRQLIHECFDQKDVKRPFAVGAYNKTLCRYETFRSGVDKDMRSAVMASAAVPVVLPPVTIDGYEYEDGGVRHLIPVAEIKRWISKTKGPKHVDVMVCFPINNYKLFMQMTTPTTSFPLITAALRSMSDIMLNQMESDLKEIAELVGVPYEVLVKSNCGEFTRGDLTVRIFSPADGEFSSFINMNPESSTRMVTSGAKAVREYLTPKLKV